MNRDVTPIKKKLRRKLLKNKLSKKKIELFSKFNEKYPSHAKKLLDAISDNGCINCVFGKKNFHCDGCEEKNMTSCNDGEGFITEWHCKECDATGCKSCSSTYCSGCISKCCICNVGVCFFDQENSCGISCNLCCEVVCSNCINENNECTRCSSDNENED